MSFILCKLHTASLDISQFACRLRTALKRDGSDLAVVELMSSAMSLDVRGAVQPRKYHDKAVQYSFMLGIVNVRDCKLLFERP